MSEAFKAPDIGHTRLLETLFQHVTLMLELFRMVHDTMQEAQQVVPYLFGTALYHQKTPGSKA